MYQYNRLQKMKGTFFPSETFFKKLVEILAVHKTSDLLKISIDVARCILTFWKAFSFSSFLLCAWNLVVSV